MAISKLEVGVVPLGVGGDSLRSAAAKINENFTNADHAASKLVGKGSSQIALNSDVGEVAFRATTGTSLSSDESITTLAQFPNGGTHHIGSTRFTDMPYIYNYTNLISFTGHAAGRFQIFHGYGGYAWNHLYMRASSNPDHWMRIYHDKNTTKDVGTGFLKVSSPVLHVYNDKIDKIHEAEQLDITVDKKGVGHYEIHGTTGLRQDDGWNMSPPRDIHGNVRCMIEVTEKDGVITVKTYKRKFDLDLAAIVHDYDNPFDIPEGACVELRFNDLPLDDLDDTQTEV